MTIFAFLAFLAIGGAITGYILWPAERATVDSILSPLTHIAANLAAHAETRLEAATHHAEQQVEHAAAETAARAEAEAAKVAALNIATLTGQAVRA